MKAQIEKLKLEPSDIVVVTIPKCSQATARRVHDQLRKVLPRGQRSIVKFEGTKVEKLADALTPEELHRLNEAMEKKLLASPLAGLPLQEGG